MASQRARCFAAVQKDMQHTTSYDTLRAEPASLHEKGDLTERLMPKMHWSFQISLLTAITFSFIACVISFCVFRAVTLALIDCASLQNLIITGLFVSPVILNVKIPQPSKAFLRFFSKSSRHRWKVLDQHGFVQLPNPCESPAPMVDWKLCRFTRSNVNCPLQGIKLPGCWTWGWDGISYQLLQIVQFFHE